MDYNRVTAKKGDGHTEDIVQNLKDAGCDESAVADICRLYDTVQVCDAVRALRRADLLQSLFVVPLGQ